MSKPNKRSAKSKSSKKPVKSSKATAPVKAPKPPKMAEKVTPPAKKAAAVPPPATSAATPSLATPANTNARTASGTAQSRVLEEKDPKKAIAALQKFGSTELQRIFSSVFGGAQTTSRNALYLRSAISKGLLDRADGATPVTPADETRAARKAPSATPMVPKPPKERDPRLPKVGSTIERIYKGDTIRVKVLEEGFSYKGETFSSLSALAKTFTHCSTNGLLWFGLTSRPDKIIAAAKSSLEA